MDQELVSAELWEEIEPLLPEQPEKPKGGGPRIDDRAAPTGILFVLKSAIVGRCYLKRWIAAPV